MTSLSSVAAEGPLTDGDEHARASRQEAAVFWFFLGAAIVVRLAYWLFTQRVWEDALIAIGAARNLWAGNGLTHHATEAPVQVFSSPVGEFVAVVGEAFGPHGLVALRLAALAAAAATLFIARRIADHFVLPISSRILLFGFLAFDQLQVMFGMAGMETQMATAILLAGLLALLTERWTMLGVVCGLALLTRPEFLLWVVLAYGAVAVTKRGIPRRMWLPTISIVGPWVLFTLIYYGSPIPNTIRAKELYPTSGLGYHPTLHQIASYVVHSWEIVAPFRSFIFTGDTPIPQLSLQATVAIVGLLAVVGVVSAMRRRQYGVIVPALLLVAFFTYRTRTLLPQFFMWYVPPFAAVLFVLASLGLSRTRELVPRASTVLAVALVGLYALPLPFAAVLDRRVQGQIEDAVRTPVGRYLNEIMDADDTVVLEPAGYIGIATLGHTIYDYPGLTSPTVVRTLKALPRSQRTIFALIDKLHPDFVVLRDIEYKTFESRTPDVAAHYFVRRTIDSAPGLDLTFHGLSYFNVDTRYVILERTEHARSG